jgi:DNA-directed RNA polymerase subunit RPC12/RpoP
MAATCPHCGYPVKPGIKFCGNCGKPLPVSPIPDIAHPVANAYPPSPGGGIACPHCGKPVRAGAKFCASCGRPVQVQGAAPVTPAVTTPPVAVQATATPVTAPTSKPLNVKAQPKKKQSWLWVLIGGAIICGLGAAAAGVYVANQRGLIHLWGPEITQTSTPETVSPSLTPIPPASPTNTVIQATATITETQAAITLSVTPSPTSATPTITETPTITSSPTKTKKNPTNDSWPWP